MSLGQQMGLGWFCHPSGRQGASKHISWQEAFKYRPTATDSVDSWV